LHFSTAVSLRDRRLRPRYGRSMRSPPGNNVEALYRDAGNIGHGAAPTLR
jgi:hypothetical protein